MTPKQLWDFLNDNEKGILVNSSDGVVKILVLQALLTNNVDLSDPVTDAGLASLFTMDRAAAFKAYAAGLPPPVDPVATMTAAGMPSAQATALGTLLAAS